MHWPDNLSCTRPLIAEGCLVPFSPGAKGNNGLMWKILQAVTSFGFRMCFTGLGEEVLYIVSVCVCVCLIVSFPVTCLRETSYREFEGIHLTINYPLHPLHWDRGASHGHLRPGNIFSPAPSHLTGAAPQCYIARWDDWGTRGGKEKKKKCHLDWAV